MGVPGCQRREKGNSFSALVSSVIDTLVCGVQMVYAESALLFVGRKRKTEKENGP